LNLNMMSIIKATFDTPLHVLTAKMMLGPFRLYRFATPYSATFSASLQAKCLLD